MTLRAPLVRRPATYQDVLDAPPNMVAEIINGALSLQPRPARPHLRAASRLGSLIATPFDLGRDGPGGWMIIDEPELHFSRSVLVPDIAGWRVEHMTESADVAFFTTAPDWLCEVLSPSTREYDLSEKRELYGRYGVGWLWFVDPLARTLEVFRNDGGWRLVKTLHGTEEVRQPPFDAVAFPLDALWPEESAG